MYEYLYICVYCYSYYLSYVDLNVFRELRWIDYGVYLLYVMIELGMLSMIF